MIGATLFSGIGAPETAMPHWQWAWAAEIDKFASAVHGARHTGQNLGDVTAHDFTSRAAEIAKPDVLVFGSPCQSFSVAGRRLGLDDPRGNLALVALGIAARVRPRWLVFENVPGLLSSASGRDFGIFLRTMEECGYFGAWRVFDAQYFGLAQRRERVFFVGCLGDWRGPAAVLFEPEGLRGDSAPRRQEEKAVAALTANGVGTCGADDNQAQAGHLIAFGVSAKSNFRGDPTAETLVSHTLRGEGFDASEDGTGKGTPLVAFSCKDNGRDASDIAPTLRAMGHGDSHANGGGQLAVAFQTRIARNGRGQPSEVVPALNGADAGATSDMRPCIATANAVRRLTPRECERLQGFPDDFTAIEYRGKPAADGPRYKALGNSMAVPVMRWILSRIETVDAIAPD